MKPTTEEKLRSLYVELDSVELALDMAMWVMEADALKEQRSEILGEIKQLERQRND